MGIKNLSKVIKKYYKPKEQKLSYYRTKKVAIDASLLIYQCLSAIRSDGQQLAFNNESTSHISGMFFKIINFVDAGIKPVFVFDGKPPDVKAKLIAQRNKRRDEAEKKYLEAKESEDKILMEKYDKRKLRITKKQSDEIKELLNHMGISYVESETEGEALCAFLCKKGQVDYVYTEDMDALCFGAPRLLRNFKKDIYVEYELKSILEHMKIDFNIFIDLCILLGCDYAETIKGIGPAKAESLIREHKTIENVLQKLKLTDYEFQHARDVFFQNDSNCQLDKIGVNWEKYNRANVIEFLKKYNFDDKRVLNGLDRYEKNKLKKGTSRLTDLFLKK